MDADGSLDVIAIGNRTVPSLALRTNSARRSAATAVTECDLFYMPSVPHVTTAVPIAIRAGSLELAVAPNPAREKVELAFVLPRPGRATAAI